MTFTVVFFREKNDQCISVTVMLSASYTFIY